MMKEDMLNQYSDDRKYAAGTVDNELSYLFGLSNVLEYGEVRNDRTGVGTKSIFGLNMHFTNVETNFPLLTTKQMSIDPVLSELLWMLEGSGDERRLAEIRYGQARADLDDKKTIWTANAHSSYWESRGLKTSEGDLGRVYGVQWRYWNDARVVPESQSLIFEERGFVVSEPYCDMVTVWRSVDQLKELIDGIKSDPFGRRHIISAWNPGELDDMALPPCHVLAQFYVHTDGRLSCLLYQRSADLFLGSPFNIAFYSMMLAMVAQVCGMKTGNLEYRIGDAHIYLNHIDAVKEQLSREDIFSPPSLVLNRDIQDIEGFTMDDVDVVNYKSHSKISAPMAV